MQHSFTNCTFRTKKDWLISLSIASITRHNVTLSAGLSETKVFEEDIAQFTYKWKAVVSRGIWTIFCRGKPRNFANWFAEFGKIFCGKLWALWALYIAIPRSTQPSIFAV